MKLSIPLTLALALALALLSIGNARAQGVVTLTCSGPNSSNEVQVAEGQYANIICHIDQHFQEVSTSVVKTRPEIVKNGKTMRLYYVGPPGQTQIAGPATIRLVCTESTEPAQWGFLTVEILPAQFPPDRAVTVGPYSGDVKVTMEMSTDLVNWTVPQNAAIYTNAPDARFFRIKIGKNIEEQPQE